MFLSETVSVDMVPKPGCLAPSYSAATNQITSTGYSYDQAGNILTDGTYGYQWDAEGRLSSVTGSGLTQTNLYNALGQLAQYSTTLPSSFSSPLIYNPAGEWIGQINNSSYWWGQYVRLNGRVIANMPNANTVFIHKDTVGSSRMTTGPSGTWLQDQVFYPWGTSWHSLGTWQEQEFGDLDLFRTDDGFYHSLSRDYNPNVARWLSPDPSGQKAADPSDPQTWNMYAYAGNNPTSLTDPTGLYICGSSMSDSQCDSFAQSLTDAQNAANNIKNEYGSFSAEYLNSQGAIDAYGARGVDNGVTIQVGALPSGEGAVTQASGGSPVTSDNPNGQNITVTFNKKPFNDDAGSAALAITSAHEGSHVPDASDWVSSGFSNAMLPTSYATESRAFGVSAAIAEGSGAYPNGLSFGSFTIWQPMWNAGQVQQGINQLLAAPGMYHVTPAHPGKVNWSKRAKPWWLP